MSAQRKAKSCRLTEHITHSRKGPGERSCSRRTSGWPKNGGWNNVVGKWVEIREVR